MPAAVAALLIVACAGILALLSRVQVRDMDAEKSVPARSMYSGVTLSTDQLLQNANVKAFLKMIRYAEGTDGGAGYHMMFGGTLFASFVDHPHKVNAARLGGREMKSSAAGAYQILSKTWDGVRGSLPDFSPASQDAAAVELLLRRGAVPFILAGDIVGAINAARKEWASLPGAGYGQPERAISDLLAQYRNAGGAFA